jgi:hypothetical protein
VPKIAIGEFVLDRVVDGRSQNCSGDLDSLTPNQSSSPRSSKWPSVPRMLSLVLDSPMILFCKGATSLTLIPKSLALAPTGRHWLD